MEIIRLVDSLPFFVFKPSFIFANKDDSKNTLNLIFIFVNFRSERTICRLTQLDQLSVEQAYLCPDLSFNLLLRRPLTRQEECTRGLSEPPLFTNGR